MAEAGKLFERFARVEALGHDIELLRADGTHPAFVVQANLLTDHQINVLRDRHMKIPKRRGRNQTGQRELDEKTYWPAWIKRVVVGWSGLTKRNLERLIIGLVWEDQAAFDELFPTGEIPYSYEFALELHQQSQNTFTAALALELNDLRESLAESEEEERDDAAENLDTGFASLSVSATTGTNPNGALESTPVSKKPSSAAQKDAIGS